MGCFRCPRLVAWREQVARERRAAFAAEEYWGRPIPGFGDLGARLLILGLAPAAHGANRTGRVFTGDRSGDFLFAALAAALPYDAVVAPEVLARWIARALGVVVAAAAIGVILVAIAGAVVELASRQIRTGRPANISELEPVVERLTMGLLADGP